MSKKTWLKYGLFIIACILLPILLEAAWFNKGVWLYGAYEETLDPAGTDERVRTARESVSERLSPEEENAVLAAHENARILAELNGVAYEPEAEKGLTETDEGMFKSRERTTVTVSLPQALYVGALRLDCPETAQGSDIEIYEENGAGRRTLAKAHIDGRIHAGSYRIGASLKDFTIIITNDDPVQDAELGLRIGNTFVWNPVRMSFFAVVFLLLGLFALQGSWLEKKPENVFAAASLLLGSLLIYAVGTNQIGYDEHIHMKEAYELSFSSTVLTTESAMQMEAASFPSFYSLEERRLVEEYAALNHDYSWANITRHSRFINYDDRSYLPAAAGFFLGRVLKLPFDWMIMLGKWINLLVYTAVCYLAVRLAVQGKALVCALALMPNCLFAAAGITYDSVVNAFLLLACVLTMNLFLDREGRITPLQTFAVLGAYAAGSTAKPIYALMAFILLFLSGRKFSGRTRQAVFKAAVLAFGFLMLYAFFFPPVSASGNFEVMGNLAYAGDRRTQGSSVLGQIGYITGHPLAYTGLLFTSMAGELWAYLSGGRAFIQYGYLGGLPVFWTWLGLAALLAAAVLSPEGEERKSAGRMYCIFNLLMVLCMSAVIWTSMYVTFTSVGSGTIEGVQGRYFIPLFFPFFSCLFQARLRIPLKKARYTGWIIAAMAAVNLYATWSLAVPRNL